MRARAHTKLDTFARFDYSVLTLFDLWFVHNFRENSHFAYLFVFHGNFVSIKLFQCLNTNSVVERWQAWRLRASGTTWYKLYLMLIFILWNYFGIYEVHASDLLSELFDLYRPFKLEIRGTAAPLVKCKMQIPKFHRIEIQAVCMACSRSNCELGHRKTQASGTLSR